MRWAQLLGLVPRRECLGVELGVDDYRATVAPQRDIGLHLRQEVCGAWAQRLQCPGNIVALHGPSRSLALEEVTHEALEQERHLLRILDEVAERDIAVDFVDDELIVDQLADMERQPVATQAPL